MTKHYSDDEVAEYAKSRGLTPDTLLWASDKPLSEDAFRSGAKNSATVDFLRFRDIDDAPIRTGRIPEGEAGDFVVAPGYGISLFIKPMLPEGQIHLGAQGSAETPAKAELKKQYDPFTEKFWWKIERGQKIPPGLELRYDGHPPGHCTLTVDRPMPVSTFLGLVAMIHFECLGTDYYGKLK
ncbi:MAG: hypothetical protein ACTHL8_01965 [Burkholderiaceae bacterium]